MTTPTEAVITILNAHAGLQALVGNGDSPETYRIYNMVRPQDNAVPSITIHKISQQRETTMSDSGGAGVENMRSRFTIYADKLSDAEAVAEQARLALKAAASATFKSVQVFMTDNYEDDTHLYQVIVDHSIWYRH